MSTRWAYGRDPSHPSRGAPGRTVEARQRARNRSPNGLQPRQLGLVRALAHVSEPSEVAEVLVSRREALEDLQHVVPPSIAKVLDKVVRAAGDVRTQQRRVAKRREEPARDLLRARPSKPKKAPASSSGGAQISKLAHKLMRLVHLAERDRSAAAAEVRLAEDTASARREGGAGMLGSALNEQDMNINRLQQEVLEYVLRELEKLDMRREDPDGHSVWW